MAIKISQGFKRTSNEPIDETLALTKAQMKAVDDSGMPEKYFTICQDDGKLYLYDKENTVDEQTGKFRILEGGSGVPAGGTTGQILAKNSDDDGDADWIVDTGKDLNKLVQWGSHTSQSPRTEYVPDITDSTTDPYHRVILHIPIQGSALEGIEATEASLKQYLKTRFKIRYNTELNGTVVFTTTTEDTAGDVSNSFGMKTNLTSGYSDSRLYIYLNETTISNNILHLAVSYYVKFSASQTNHYGKPKNVVLVANNGYTFGIIDVNDPYYIHNSTKIALDDLKINNFNVPTSWGVATSGTRQVAIVNKVGQFTVDIRDLNITNVNDYNVVTEIIGGGTGAWGDSNCYLWEKSTNRFAGSVTTVGNDVDRVDISYVVVAKGYGNLVSGGGGSVPENIMTARATTGAGNVDIYSITGSSNEYTPVDDKVTMDLRVIQGGTYGDLPQFNISTAGAGTSLYSKHLATKDYVDSKEPGTITNQEIDTIIFG